MYYISLGQVLELHRRIIEQSGGAPGILNLEALESALQQPRITFGREYLYPTPALSSQAFLRDACLIML
jgi:death on curing protein